MLHTREVLHGQIKITVGRAMMGTPLIAAIYYNILSERYPEMKAAVIPTPEPAAFGANGDESERFALQAAAAAVNSPLAWNRMQSVDQFTATAARILSVEGASWTLSGVNQRPDPEHLEAAYVTYLFEVIDEDDPGLWVKIRAAIAELDAPLVTREKLPVSKLTPTERADPN